MNPLAAEIEHVSEAFNIATGQETSISEVAEVIQEVNDTDSDIVHVEEREGDIDRSVADIEQARRTLGFEPEVGWRRRLPGIGKGFKDVCNRYLLTVELSRL